jgi:primase-polymerase (primpol)-like protein
VIEKATSAANGAKFERLWNGSTAGYESHSEADMALCFQLAFWTGGDADQMDRLFRRSGLMRQKWDEVHFADGSTYGEKTLERAVARVTEFYEPPAAQTQSPTGERNDTDSAIGESVEQRSSPQPANSEQREQQLLGLIDRLEARVEALEAENDELQAKLARSRSESERQQKPTERPSDDEPVEAASLWAWLPSWFRKFWKISDVE